VSEQGNEKATDLVRGDAMQRARRARDLRLLGTTWDDIAAAVGYSDKCHAHRAVQHYLGEVPRLAREQLRDEWRDRLDWLWTQAVQAVLAERPGAVTAAVRVQSSAASLDGLDAPQEVVVHSPTSSELDAWVARMVSVQQPAVPEFDILAPRAIQPPD
jgi:AraC-like DNA-binding protein